MMEFHLVTDVVTKGVKIITQLRADVSAPAYECKDRSQKMPVVKLCLSFAKNITYVGSSSIYGNIIKK